MEGESLYKLTQCVLCPDRVGNKNETETNKIRMVPPMALVGAGNWWDKKDKYSNCEECGKKGSYKTSLVDKNNQIHTWIACMFCKAHKNIRSD